MLELNVIEIIVYSFKDADTTPSEDKTKVEKFGLLSSKIFFPS